METRIYKASFADLLLLLLVLFSVVIAFNTANAETGRHASHLNLPVKPVDIIRDATDLPGPIAKRAPRVVHVTLTTEEVVGTLDAAAGTTYRYWTFNGKVPGPMIRVRHGDTLEVTLRNSPSSHMTHSIDLHAALGPGGGAALSQVIPGQSKTFAFQATTPGLFVYHCGTPMIAEHMANGMYGLILVEPENGLSRVDHEYYVMQGEIYTTAPKGKEGFQQFSAAKLMSEAPEYSVLNGAVDALTGERAMPSKVGETVRVFFGNAGPNQTAATHVVGEIFTHVYELGSLTSAPLAGVQTAGVPPGAAAILELDTKIPGKFGLMDHSITRMAKGNMAVFNVAGPENAELMHAGAATQEAASQNAGEIVRGITVADDATNDENSVAAISQSLLDTAANGNAEGSEMEEMIHMQSRVNATARKKSTAEQVKSIASGTSLNGCLTIAADGKAILNELQSTKLYRLEAQPFLFSQNANRLVHVSGYFGSVLTKEDPNVPSFVVKTLDSVAPDCSTKISAAQIQKALVKKTAATRGMVGMSDMGFLPQTLTVSAGDRVVWKNSSEVTHNVIADPGKALYAVDVKLPSGVAPFGSGFLQPGQSFSRVFNVPGIYRYVCTLHEGSGMKGVIIVKGAQVLTASK